MSEFELGLIVLAVIGVLWAALDIVLAMRWRGLRRDVRQAGPYADPGRRHRETQRALDRLATRAGRRP